MNDAAINNETSPRFASSLDLPDLTETFLSGAQTAFTDGEKFVVFFLDDALFAIPAREVTEVIRPLRHTPLPGAPVWLTGIANLRGEIISIVDLAQFCHKAAAPVTPKSKFIVLRPKMFDAPVAFPIDKLNEIITLGKEEIRFEAVSYFFGKAVYKSNPVYLLDTNKIFSSLLLGS